MRRPARQHRTTIAVGLICSVMGSIAAGATPSKLVIQCSEPSQSVDTAPASLSCAVRANGLAEIETVTAAIKGQAESLATTFTPYDPTSQATTTAYLIQLLPNARRTTLGQMGDAVVTFTTERAGKRRFMAYTFGEELNLIADSGASTEEFVRQLFAVKPHAGKTYLYKSALDAIEMLAKEPGERKSLVILGDGASDDADANYDQVVKAAKDAGVTIHVLGYSDTTAQRANFEKLSSLAEATNGYAAEVKQGAGKDKDFTKTIVTNRFAHELLENGGTLTASLTGPVGSQTLAFDATLEGGEKLATEQAIVIPAPPQPAFETTVQRADPEPEPEQTGWGWLFAFGGIVLLIAGAAYAAFKYRPLLTRLATVRSAMTAPAPAPQAEPAPQPAQADPPQAVQHEPRRKTQRIEPEPVIVAPPPETRYVSHDDVHTQVLTEPVRAHEAHPAVYGWLETVDGNAARHPLRTTNVRVGRHRDNDICLLNDSISRRHAVLHYNPDTRRFVITDLGGGNGVVVNRTKYKSRELNDGDMVELGEVRLRYRAETEFTA